MEEREIDLIDLMVEILYRWKGLILSMIICTLLLGGFGYYKSYREVKAAAAGTAVESETTPEQEEASARQLLTETSVSVVDQILNSEASLAGYMKYYNTSVLMKIDPYNVPWTYLVYSIHTDGNEDAADLSALYVQAINAEIGNTMAEAVEGLTASQATELFNVSNVVYSNENSSNDAVLTVKVRHSDVDTCGKMADAVDALVKSLAPVVGGDHSNHTVKQVSRDAYTAIDMSLYNSQKSYRDTIVNLRNTIAVAKDKLTADELAYYDLLAASGKYDSASKQEMVEQINDTIEEAKESLAEERRKAREAAAAAASAATMNAKPSVSVKYLFIGLILGAFVYAGGAAVVYILRNVVRYVDDTAAIFGVFRLGAIPDEKRWNQNGYTRWLRKVRDRGMEAISREQAVGVTAVSIVTLAEKKELTNLCIIGRNVGKFNQDVQDALLKALPENLRVGTADNILSDPEAMKVMAGYDGVVLLEKAGETKYEEIATELKVIKAQGQTLLGAVITE